MLNACLEYPALEDFVCAASYESAITTLSCLIILSHVRMTLLMFACCESQGTVGSFCTVPSSHACTHKLLRVTCSLSLSSSSAASPVTFIRLSPAYLPLCVPLPLCTSQPADRAEVHVESLADELDKWLASDHNCFRASAPASASPSPPLLPSRGSSTGDWTAAQKRAIHCLH